MRAIDALVDAPAMHLTLKELSLVDRTTQPRFSASSCHLVVGKVSIVCVQTRHGERSLAMLSPLLPVAIIAETCVVVRVGSAAVALSTRQLSFILSHDAQALEQHTHWRSEGDGKQAGLHDMIPFLDDEELAREMIVKT